MGQIASTAWNSSGTLPVQLQQWNPCKWQDQDGSQGGQNYHCMVSGIELERHATGHERLNQQSEKPHLRKQDTKLDCIRITGGYLQLRSFTFFVL